MRYSVLLILVIFLLPLRVPAQHKECVLLGTLQMNGGESSRYKLVFTMTGDNFKGYAITYMNDGLELRSSIKGSIDKALHIFSFKEMVDPGVTMFEDCMVEAHVPYKLQNGHYYLKGSFKGKKNDFTCSEGTISFDAAKELNHLFEPPKMEHEAVAAGIDVKSKPGDGYEAKLPPNTLTLTADVEKVYDFGADTCRMDIWDSEYIDGDIVTLVYNGRVVLADYTLVRKKKQVLLPLTEQVNILTIIAENEGKVPPNTSRITLTDGKVKHNAVASINKGQGAVIILRRK
jgi:hypothetical protein